MATNEISRVYAQSLYDLVVENGALLRCEEELEFVCQLIQNDPELKILINNPAISSSRKKQFVENVFKDHMSQDLVSFLHVLIDNDRQGYLDSIYESFVGLIDEKENRQRVTIVTSTAIEKGHIANIKNDLQTKLHKEIVLTVKEDPSILGGMIVTINDCVIDGSLISNLKNLKNSLLECGFRREVIYED